MGILKVSSKFFSLRDQLALEAFHTKMSDYHRPLYNMDVAEDFVIKVLGYLKKILTTNYIVAIVKEERYPMFVQDTLTNQEIHDEKYRNDNDRNELRLRFFKEMVTIKCLVD